MVFGGAEFRTSSQNYAAGGGKEEKKGVKIRISYWNNNASTAPPANISNFHLLNFQKTKHFTQSGRLAAVNIEECRKGNWIATTFVANLGCWPTLKDGGGKWWKRDFHLSNFVCVFFANSLHSNLQCTRGKDCVWWMQLKMTANNFEENVGWRTLFQPANWMWILKSECWHGFICLCCVCQWVYVWELGNRQIRAEQSLARSNLGSIQCLTRSVLRLSRQEEEFLRFRVGPFNVGFLQLMMLDDKGSLPEMVRLLHQNWERKREKWSEEMSNCP